MSPLRYGPVTAFTIPTGGSPPGTGSAVAVLGLTLSKLTATTTSLTSTAPMTVIADGSQSTIDPSLTITNWLFNFGDGTTISGWAMRAVHTYATAGSYTVTLTVTDSNGGTSSTTASVTVNALGAFDVTIALGDNVASKWNAAASSAKISIAAGTHTNGVIGITPKASQVVVAAGSGSTILNAAGQNAYAFTTNLPNNVKIRGIKFQNYKTGDREQGSVRIVGASNCTGWRLSDIIVDSCGAASTAAGCFSTFLVSDFIMDTYVISNGAGMGRQVVSTTDSVFANGEVHHNGASSNTNVYNDTGGGGKWNHVSKNWILREYGHDNTGHALWFDSFSGETDIRDIRYQFNTGSGVMFEICNSSQVGPDNHASAGTNGTGYNFQLWGGLFGDNGGSMPNSGVAGDVYCYDSDKIDAQHNIIGGNSSAGKGGISLNFASRSEGGHTDNWNIQHNDIRAAGGSGAVFFVHGSAGTGTNYTPSGNVIDNNRYFMTNALTDSNHFAYPTSSTTTTNANMTVWRSQGYDVNSSTADIAVWPH